MATIRFGPYELVHRLGAGGMAETLLGVRRGPGAFRQKVCVKRILPALESDPEMVAHFLNEARLAATLRHKNIAQVIDFGDVDGTYYLALELIDGRDMRALLGQLAQDGLCLDPEVVTYIGLELASALEFAHAGGDDRPPMAHRDVSPSNVLLSRDGQVYLSDFGIARALYAADVGPPTDVRGKLPYLAPEYRQTGRADARTDLFGLGVLLYEALAGRRPFDDAVEAATSGEPRGGRYAPLRSAAPDVPERLTAVVERLIEPDPRMRFSDARALLDALGELAPPTTVVRRLAQIVRESGESLTEPLRRSGALPTLALGENPGPRDPEVRPSDPHAVTRTAPQPATPAAIARDADAGRWAATDPDHLSPHGARALPPTANHKPGAKRVSTRRGVSWGLVFGVSTLTFTLASALAYAVVSIAQRAS